MPYWARGHVTLVDVTATYSTLTGSPISFQGTAVAGIGNDPGTKDFSSSWNSIGHDETFRKQSLGGGSQVMGVCTQGWAHGPFPLPLFPSGHALDRSLSPDPPTTTCHIFRATGAGGPWTETTCRETLSFSLLIISGMCHSNRELINSTTTKHLNLLSSWWHQKFALRVNLAEKSAVCQGP